MKENEINALDELSKGSCMGIDAINFIMDKVTDSNLKEELERQCNEYKEIASKVEKIYKDYSDSEPHETNIVNKAMTWYGIEMKTLTDESTSKIAELLMQGTNMGIIEGRRLLNRKDLEPKVDKLISEYVNMQEKAVEKLKNFL